MSSEGVQVSARLHVPDMNDPVMAATDLVRIMENKAYSEEIASFPGPTQISITCSTESVYSFTCGDREPRTRLVERPLIQTLPPQQGPLLLQSSTKM